MPLASVCHEERLYTGPVPRNGAGELADGKTWVSMPLSWNEFTIPTRITLLAFGLSTNVRLTLPISWLHTPIQYMHKARSESWLIARVWL